MGLDCYTVEKGPLNVQKDHCKLKVTGPSGHHSILTSLCPCKSDHQYFHESKHTHQLQITNQYFILFYRRHKKCRSQFWAARAASLKFLSIQVAFYIEIGNNTMDVIPTYTSECQSTVTYDYGYNHATGYCGKISYVRLSIFSRISSGLP